MRTWQEVKEYQRRVRVMQGQARYLRLSDRIGQSMAGRLANLAARKGLSHIAELAECTLYGTRNVGVKTVALIEMLWPAGSWEPPIGRIH